MMVYECGIRIWTNQELNLSESMVLVFYFAYNPNDFTIQPYDYLGMIEMTGRTATTQRQMM